jgi:hypothetical protein
MVNADRDLLLQGLAVTKAGCTLIADFIKFHVGNPANVLACGEIGGE